MPEAEEKQLTQQLPHPSSPSDVPAEKAVQEVEDESCFFREPEEEPRETPGNAFEIIFHFQGAWNPGAIHVPPKYVKLGCLG